MYNNQPPPMYVYIYLLLCMSNLLFRINNYAVNALSPPNARAQAPGMIIFLYVKERAFTW